ncbi:hypothetical protein [Streptococcus pneumoniae]|nr:hypothetical protein [Streptococcus pneumoniae]
MDTSDAVSSKQTDEVSSKHGFVYLDTSDAVSNTLRQGDVDVV